MVCWLGISEEEAISVTYRRFRAIKIVIPIANSIFLIEGCFIGTQVWYPVTLFIAHVEYLQESHSFRLYPGVSKLRHRSRLPDNCIPCLRKSQLDAWYSRRRMLCYLNLSIPLFCDFERQDLQFPAEIRRQRVLDLK